MFKAPLTHNCTLLTLSPFSFLAACSLLAFITGCGESCEKTMTVIGTATDGASTQPLSGVNIYCCTADETTPIAVTGADGKYSFSTSKLGGFAGAKARFEKAGYVTRFASEFTETEAGITRCGSYTVSRNINLTP